MRNSLAHQAERQVLGREHGSVHRVARRRRRRRSAAHDSRPRPAAARSRDSSRRPDGGRRRRSASMALPSVAMSWMESAPPGLRARRRAGAPRPPGLYPDDSSRLTVCVAPRLSSSTWMSPIPPPISSTVAPATPRRSRKATIRAAVLSRPRRRYRFAIRRAKRGLKNASQPARVSSQLIGQPLCATRSVGSWLTTAGRAPSSLAA